MTDLSPTELRDAFAHVDFWIFDLDNTLYPRPVQLWIDIDKRMTEAVSELLEVDLVEARRVQKDYLVRYGATVKGLMVHHNIPPEDFLEQVHDVDLSEIKPNAKLADAIDRLPGRKIIHTNAVRSHAERVLKRLAFPAALFDSIHDIETTGYDSKPASRSYDIVFDAERADPARAAFFEDSACNLVEPHRRGMRTIFIPTDCEFASLGSDGAHVQFIAENLTQFVGQLSEALG